MNKVNIKPSHLVFLIRFKTCQGLYESPLNQIIDNDGKVVTKYNHFYDLIFSFDDYIYATLVEYDKEFNKTVTYLNNFTIANGLFFQKCLLGETNNIMSDEHVYKYALNTDEEGAWSDNVKEVSELLKCFFRDGYEHGGSLTFKKPVAPIKPLEKFPDLDTIFSDKNSISDVVYVNTPINYNDVSIYPIWKSPAFYYNKEGVLVEATHGLMKKNYNEITRRIHSKTDFTKERFIDKLKEIYKVNKNIYVHMGYVFEALLESKKDIVLVPADSEKESLSSFIYRIENLEYVRDEDHSETIAVSDIALIYLATRDSMRLPNTDWSKPIVNFTIKTDENSNETFLYFTTEVI